MRSFFLVAIAFCLSACTTAHIETADTIGQTAEQAALQQDLLEPCQPLPKLEERMYTQAESFEVMKIWASMYYNCSKKHQALAELLEFKTLPEQNK